jgi:Holliday junction resolvase RusA-like endonuclease
VSAKRRLFPVVKPDWDNLGKMLSDALNQVIWSDDAQICEAHVYKRYSDSFPYTRVLIEDLFPADNEVLEEELGFS